jgi:hypothetical protein
MPNYLPTSVFLLALVVAAPTVAEDKVSGNEADTLLAHARLGGLLCFSVFDQPDMQGQVNSRRSCDQLCAAPGAACITAAVDGHLVMCEDHPATPFVCRCCAAAPLATGVPLRVDPAQPNAGQYKIITSPAAGNAPPQ